jgi:hypothetical protein
MCLIRPQCDCTMSLMFSKNYRPILFGTHCQKMRDWKNKCVKVIKIFMTTDSNMSSFMPKKKKTMRKNLEHKSQIKYFFLFFCFLFNGFLIVCARKKSDWRFPACFDLYVECFTSQKCINV